MKANTTDLQDAEAPEHVAMILRNAAQHYYESSSELASAWQDPGAGKLWNRIARDLERCAARLEKYDFPA